MCATAQYLRFKYRNKDDKWMSCFIVLVRDVCWVLCTRLNGLIHVCCVNLTLETYQATSTHLIVFRNKYSWQDGNTG